MPYRVNGASGAQAMPADGTSYPHGAHGGTPVRARRGAEPLRLRWRSLHDAIGGLSKRGLDIVLVLAASPFFLPLMAGVALLVRLGGPGPIFYGHERVGHGGQRFRCWKFRTMVVDADRVLDAHFRRNPEDLERWRRERKLSSDPRVTPLGAVLRKLSIDELPQLWNVFVGEMSLVGPRPVVEDELAIYGRSASHYMRARPGLTGLWQISGRSDVSYRQRVHLDRLYLRHWSLPLDLWILLRTVPAVIQSRGAR